MPPAPTSLIVMVPPLVAAMSMKMSVPSSRTDKLADRETEVRHIDDVIVEAAVGPEVEDLDRVAIDAIGERHGIGREPETGGRCSLR